MQDKRDIVGCLICWEEPEKSIDSTGIVDLHACYYIFAEKTRTKEFLKHRQRLSSTCFLKRLLLGSHQQHLAERNAPAGSSGEKYLSLSLEV